MKREVTRRQGFRRQGGYTLVELMMAIALFAIAVLAIVAMQKITVVSNGHAKNLAMAQRIAQSWATQLELDSTTWRTGLGGTNWLGNVGGGWVRPNYVGAQNFGAAFDALGNPLPDVPGALARARFCSHVRLTWLYPAAAPVSGNGLMRAEVRVFWQRVDGANVIPTASLCAAVDTAVIGSASDVYHFVYQTTGVRQHSSI